MLEKSFELDETDWTLLGELQSHARVTLSEASRRIGLTAPALGERMRRLEEAGVIRGYHAVLDLEKIGRPLLSFIRVRFSGGKYEAFERLVKRSPEILECHHITGEDCFILKVAVAKMPDLEQLTSALAKFGATATSIVYSTVVGRRIISAADRQ